jgi:DNA-binding MarR family transcriptional regulator
MNQKWIKIILVASLALNLAFVSYFVYEKFEQKSYRESRRYQRREKKAPRRDRVKLTDEQRKKIRKIFKAFRIDSMGYKKDILDKRIAIFEAIGTDNLEVIEERTNELNQLEAQLNHRFVGTILKVNELLEPEQRFKFLQHMGENWFMLRNSPPRSPRPPRPKEFDRKGGTNE